jgi:D-3-phosphoglycerate dehydrogenase / 2-oxoglutarate reductase
MTYRILVSDNLHPKGVALFQDTDAFQVDVKTDLKPDQLLEIIGEYHGMVIRSATKVTADLLKRAANLKVVGRAGTGLDNVDIAEAGRRGVAVMNTPGGNSEAAAEHALSLIMAAHRHIPQAAESMKSGKWEKKKFQGREMAGKTVGVIGLGKIGGIVAKRASKGLKMRVLGFDPVTTPEVASQVGATLASLDEIYERSDVITVHTPLSDETRDLINADAFAKMKDNVILVNCARGGIVNEADLLQALESGKVAAAALDVFVDKQPGQSDLVMHPRVIATPHLGASTEEAQVNVAISVAEQIIDFLRDGIVRNAVNVPAVGPADRAKVEPYLDLSLKLAAFAASLVTGGVTEMDVEYRGPLADWDLRPITNAALVGLLSRSEGGDVNYVNAPFIAKDRGIRVSETTRKNGTEHGSSLAIKVTGTKGPPVTVLGALIQRIGYEPRIIGIDNYVTEAVPAGPMLIVTNDDVPGMIAGMAGVLATNRINIAQMNLSREAAGGTALSIINIDSVIDESVVKQILDIKGILSVKQVVLDD